jgi:hypothetical protein
VLHRIAINGVANGAKKQKTIDCTFSCGTFPSTVSSMGRLARVFILSAATLAAGCRSMGPAAISCDHANFNRAIAHTLDEQLLLNVVRARYLEPILFLDVGTVTDSRSHSYRAGTDGTKVFVDPSDKIMELIPAVGIAASQTPTVVYTPMQGRDFVRRIFSPLPLPLIISAIQSGWSASRVFGVFVERLNNLQNAPSASGPTPTRAPQCDEFYRMAQLLDVLLRSGGATIDIDPDNRKCLVVQFYGNDENSQSIREIKELLDLPQRSDRFSFQENFLGSVDSDLRLRTRSIQSAMFYLGNGVEIPNEHVERGIVPITRYPNGELFDWSEILSPLLTVHCSRERPDSAFVAVSFRGYWFYIADGDVASKSTFLLLANSFSLQAGDAKSLMPTLSVSIGDRSGN